MKKLRLFVFLLIILVSVSANAALVDNGDGTVTQYRNDGSMLMWLKDANTAGLMYWNDAVTWANSLVYAGYDDWRLPVALPVNGSSYNYVLSYNGSTDYSYNITSPNSEMSYMFYVELGNTGARDTSGNTTGCEFNPTNCLANTGPFINLQPRNYWSETEYNGPDYDPNVDYIAWSYSYELGLQGPNHSNDRTYAWAVRGGYVGAPPVIPEPISSILFVTGGTFLAGRRYLRSAKERKYRSAKV